MNISKSLTWEELASKYDASNSGRPARTLPMDDIFKWAEQNKDVFYVCPKEGTIHEIVEMLK